MRARPTTAAALLALFASGCDLLAFEPTGSKNSTPQTISPGVQQIIGGTVPPPAWIALQAGYVYFTSPDGNTVARVPNFVGGNLETLCCTTGERPQRLAVSSSYLWFTSSQGVSRVDLNSMQRQLINPASSYGIAFTPSNIFWTQDGGNVMQAALDGSNPIQIAGGQGRPEAITTDPNAVYWLPTTGGPWPMRYPFPSGPAQNLSANGSISFSTGQILVDGTEVYWTDPDQGGLYKVTTNSGSQTLDIVTDHQNRPMGIALDTNYVYWTNQGDGTVVRLPRLGGSAQTIATGQATPTGIVVDGSGAYWANQGNSNNVGGSIMHWSLPPGG